MNSEAHHGETRVSEQQPIDAQAPIHELLATRRSPRAFAQRAVESEKLLSLFEAARWSPSSSNEQPWRFIVAFKEDTPIFSALVASLSERNQRWAERAPVLVLALTQSTYSRSGGANRHAWYDLGQSVAYLTVEATALGLAVHQMGGFSGDNIRHALSIPEGFEPVVVFAVGYPEEGVNLPEELRKREQAPRSRKLLKDFVYTDEWGEPSSHLPKSDIVLTQPSTN